MPTEKENENAKNEGIFGVEPDSMKTYALIQVSWEQENSLMQDIKDKGGDYLSLKDGEFGFSNGIIIDLSLEDIINLAPHYGIDRFIFGANSAPSTPYFYKKNEKDSFEDMPLEPIISYEDLEGIAPECSDIWEDLYFNDYFKESLWSRNESFCEDNEDVE